MFLGLVLFKILLSPVFASEQTNIRVCLSKNSTTAIYRVVHGSYMLRDTATNLLIANLQAGDVVTVDKAGNNLIVSINSSDKNSTYAGPLIATPADETDLNVFSYRNIQYRDSISIGIDSLNLLVVNVLDMERYLYGVVGKEMGYTAPLEALKTQAVVSRTYAMAFWGLGLKYDLRIDTSNQVYGGYSAEKISGAEKVIEAVKATKGQIIYYYNDATKKKEIVKAYFHANAGGYTENSENVWSQSLPYIKAVPSPDDTYAVEYSKETNQSWAASSFQWEVSYSKEELAEAIDQYNNSSTSPIDIGDFQQIKLFRVNRDGITPTESSRVTRMELVGSRGSSSVYRDAIRRVFGLKSTMFDIKSDSSIVIKDGAGKKYKINEATGLKVINGEKKIKELNNSGTTFRVVGRTGTKDIKKQFQNLTFVGQGHGHGLGLSQWGARGMAHNGYNYSEIIEHYYNQGRHDSKLTIDTI